MGEEGKTKKNTKIDTINKLKALWEQNPELTREQLAVLTGYAPSYVDQLWSYITGHNDISELDGGKYVTYVTPKEQNEAQVPVVLQIPEFVPKCKHVIDRNGKECTDVSEFFGIIEYGGECYKDVHYTIPKGRVDLRGEIYENGIME